VALANLYPVDASSQVGSRTRTLLGTSTLSTSSPPLLAEADGVCHGSSPETQIILPAEAGLAAATGAGERPSGERDDDLFLQDGGGEPEGLEDLNSFMYQTVGHQIIPLYAEATGLPLYRQTIRGGALHHGRDYDPGPVNPAGQSPHHAADSDNGPAARMDETESMIPLLETVKRYHPEANAICAGAILSTYQRTRVESVALRLGLTPLAYLWKYPILPPPSLPSDEAQLLYDMAAAGLVAQIIKVASAGLDEDFLWTTASSIPGARRVKSAMRKYGVAEGSVLGEGGEFETLVIDGPSILFRKKIIVPEDARTVVREGGGCSWLNFRKASLESKVPTEVSKELNGLNIRIPEGFDARFKAVFDHISTSQELTADPKAIPTHIALSFSSITNYGEHYWRFTAGENANLTIEEETSAIIRKFKTRLESSSLPSTMVTNTTIVLRNMADFPNVNKIYATAFTHANPPSRVTISCGSLLPDGVNIAVYMNLRPDVPFAERNGLHVQSRSYWAPANIGPYSQAIDIPLKIYDADAPDTDATTAGPRSVMIAGQIPLVPSTMALPPPSETNLQLQIVLSLQHLWRIGVDLKVQFWSSVVAYFPRSSSPDEMQHRASLAAATWTDAHAWSKGDGDEGGTGDIGLDLWDKRYNTQFISFGSEDKSSPALPEWDVLSNGRQDDETGPAPPFFAVEVEELPRQSAVEWHAHIGLSNLTSSTIQVARCSSSTTNTGGDLTNWEAHQLAVKTPDGGTFLHTSVSISSSDGQASSIDLVEVVGKAADAFNEALRQTTSNALQLAKQTSPYLLYIDTTKVGNLRLDSDLDSDGDLPTAIIPCRSVWSAGGECVTAVALFKSYVI
jgi:diphthine-ammonia ligase